MKQNVLRLLQLKMNVPFELKRRRYSLKATILNNEEIHSTIIAIIIQRKNIFSTHFLYYFMIKIKCYVQVYQRQDLERQYIFLTRYDKKLH